MGACTGLVYSPPFAYGDEGLGGGGLYKYSSSERDLSNAGGYTEFFEQYGFFVTRTSPPDDAGPVERCALHGHPRPATPVATPSSTSPVT